MNAFIKVVSLKFPNTESVGVQIIIISNLPSDAGEGPWFLSSSVQIDIFFHSGKYQILHKIGIVLFCIVLIEPKILKDNIILLKFH